MNLTQKEWDNLTHATDYILMEAAMCAWEHLLESEKYDFEDMGGFGQVRMCCASLAPYIHLAYCLANVDDQLDGYAYDWEFVPWFLDTCVIWDTPEAYIHGEPNLVKGWLEKCRRPDFLPDPKDELLRKCLRALGDNQELAAEIERTLK